MALAYLAEMTVAIDAAGTLATLRYATEGYNHPSAPGFYDGRIEQPMNFRRDIVAEGMTSGRSVAGAGELVLVNADGALDPLIGYGFAGRGLVVLAGEQGATYASFVTVLKGTMEQPVFDFDRATIRIRDRQYEFEKPNQPTLYAGTNSGSPLAGIEGLPGDLKATPKPLCYGEVKRVPAPCVNTDRLIFQLHDGALEDVIAVYDNGVALSRGSDYADQTAMEATAPTAGQYRVWKGGGCFRVGSAPAGQITADAKGSKTGDSYVVTAAQIAKRIALDQGGLDSGDLSAADVTALDIANGATIGIWIAEARDIASVLDDVLGSVGAWWGFDRLGVLRLKRLEAPAGSPAATFKRLVQGTTMVAGDGDIVEIERLAANDPAAGIPVWRVTVRYTVNYAQVNAGEIGAVAQAERGFLAREFRQASASDATIKDQFLNAAALEVTTQLTTESAAQAEADRLLALRKARRDLYRVRVRLDGDQATALDLGSIVKLELPRFGLDAGKLFVVTGLGTDAAAGLLDINLWG